MALRGLWLWLSTLAGKLPQFCYPGQARLHGSKDRFDRQRAQAGDVQGWATEIFFARLTGESSKHSAMLWLRRDPVDTVALPP